MANKPIFRGKQVDRFYLCFSIKSGSKSLMTTLVFSRSLATALKFLEVW